MTSISDKGDSLVGVDSELPQESPQLSRQQLQAQKMASLGTFSRYINHDINNMLTIILANMEMAGLTIDADSPAQLNLQKAQRAADSISQLISGLSLLGADRNNKIEELELGGNLTEALDYLEKLLPNSIRLNREITESPLTIRGRESDIPQVLLNLFANSIEAIGLNSGEVTVSLSGQAQDDENNPDAQRCLLTVTDTGSGIEDSLVEQIFDPFFTTKIQGIGNGLGLTANRTIISSLGGQITAASDPATGTTFKIVLPTLKPAE